jgi:uncharacterized protein involved in type VI secretion and phage assembly
MPENIIVKVGGKTLKDSIDAYRLKQSIDGHHVLEVHLYALGLDSQTGMFQDRDKHLGWLGQSIALSIDTDENPEAWQSEKYDLFTGVVTEVRFEHGTVKDSWDESGRDDDDETGPNAEGLYHFRLTAHSPTLAMDKARRNRLFHDVTVKDVITAVVSEHSITKGDIASTSGIMPCCVQYQETDWEFIQRLATGAGLFAYYDGLKFIVGKAHSKGPRDGISAPNLAWGQSLRSFAMGVGTDTDIFSSQVYDYMEKKVLVGETASRPRTSLSNQAKTSHDASKGIYTHSSHVPGLKSESQSSLDGSLETVRESHICKAIPCKGTAMYVPILVGSCINVDNIGVLCGKYWVTGATLQSRLGFSEYFFTCSPLEAAHPIRKYFRKRFTDVQSALVTSTDDPDNLGRVEVAFFWNDGSSQANPKKWLRVLTPHAGNERGFFCLPEIDDEVLVAFEHGDPDRPIVLGSLYNGKDKAPTNHPAGFDATKNDLKLFRTKADNEILFHDADGSEKISIVQKDGANVITLDMSGPSITIESTSGDIIIKGATISLESTSGDITIDSAGAVKMESAADTEIKAGANLKAKGTANADFEGGALVKVAGTKTSVEGSAMTEIKGAIVKIN